MSTSRRSGVIAAVFLALQSEAKDYAHVSLHMNGVGATPCGSQNYMYERLEPVNTCLPYRDANGNYYSEQYLYSGGSLQWATYTDNTCTSVNGAPFSFTAGACYQLGGPVNVKVFTTPIVSSNTLDSRSFSEISLVFNEWGASNPAATCQASKFDGSFQLVAANACQTTSGSSSLKGSCWPVSNPNMNFKVSQMVYSDASCTTFVQGGNASQADTTKCYNITSGDPNSRAKFVTSGCFAYPVQNDLAFYGGLATSDSPFILTTMNPTAAPTTTIPTTVAPTQSPRTFSPTFSTCNPTGSPTSEPTVQPTTKSPTTAPTVGIKMVDIDFAHTGTGSLLYSQRSTTIQTTIRNSLSSRYQIAPSDIEVNWMKGSATDQLKARIAMLDAALQNMTALAGPQLQFLFGYAVTAGSVIPFQTIAPSVSPTAAPITGSPTRGEAAKSDSTASGASVGLIVGPIVGVLAIGIGVGIYYYFFKGAVGATKVAPVQMTANEVTVDEV